MAPLKIEWKHRCNSDAHSAKPSVSETQADHKLSDRLPSFTIPLATLQWLWWAARPTCISTPSVREGPIAQPAGWRIGSGPEIPEPCQWGLSPRSVRPEVSVLLLDGTRVNKLLNTPAAMGPTWIHVDSFLFRGNIYTLVVQMNNSSLAAM